MANAAAVQSLFQVTGQKSVIAALMCFMKALVVVQRQPVTQPQSCGFGMNCLGAGAFLNDGHDTQQALAQVFTQKSGQIFFAMVFTPVRADHDLNRRVSLEQGFEVFSPAEQTFIRDEFTIPAYGRFICLMQHAVKVQKEDRSSQAG